jgi:hypothetical protein
VKYGVVEGAGYLRRDSPPQKGMTEDAPSLMSRMGIEIRQRNLFSASSCFSFIHRLLREGLKNIIETY